MPLLQVAAPIFIGEGLPCPPQVVDELTLYFKDAGQEIFLTSGHFLQLRSQSLQLYTRAAHMHFSLFSFTLLAGKVAADEGWAVAVCVYAHPLELLGALAAQSLRLGHLELAQQGLQAGITVDDLLDLHILKI